MVKEELRKYLEEIKYPETEEILQFVDSEKDIESLYNKIQFLKKNGVENEGISFIISENPLFLSTTLENVKNTVNFLKNINLKDIVRTIEIYPELLSVPEKQLSENYKLLKILMSERDLQYILSIDGEILTFNTDYLENRLEFFIKNGFKDKIKELILNEFESFEDEEDEIDLKGLKERLL